LISLFYKNYIPTKYDKALKGILRLAVNHYRYELSRWKW